MIYIGFGSILFGIVLVCITHAFPWYFFLAPPTIVFVLLCSFGPCLISYRPSDIGNAFSAFFQNSHEYSKMDLLRFSKIFSLLSRYSIRAGWLGFAIGLIDTLRFIEETIHKFSEVGLSKVASGVSLAGCSILLGIIFSYFIFSPMENALEQKSNSP